MSFKAEGWLIGIYGVLLLSYVVIGGIFDQFNPWIASGSAIVMGVVIMANDYRRRQRER